ncbi:MAG: hypothetical protein K9N10_03090 [Deltaproteobacteria bacterium]|nr:hypothetical protein [Deltaproteobacteria bacterium]
MWRDVGSRVTEIEFPGELPEGTVSLGQLAFRLGLSLADAESPLLIIVNGEIIPPDEMAGLKLHDCDHVELYIMLAGG